MSIEARPTPRARRRGRPRRVMVRRQVPEWAREHLRHARHERLPAHLSFLESTIACVERSKGWRQ